MKRMTTLVLALSGCVDTGTESGGSSSESDNDTLSVKMLDAQSVQFTWKKNYDGYSEVLLRKERVFDKEDRMSFFGPKLVPLPKRLCTCHGDTAGPYFAGTAQADAKDPCRPDVFDRKGITGYDCTVRRAV